MGMKTSCCWLGDRWKIITKKLGSQTEYTVDVEVRAVAESRDATLEVQEKAVANADEHYTRIEVADLHRRLHGRTLGRARSYLVEMYRPDILNGDLELRWDGVPLEPAPVEPLVTEDGEVEREWKTDVAFDVDGHRVQGWICILNKGARSRAGFDLFRRGRVILGRPLGYRPHTIFGEARNDLINQRLYGQLQMDTFPVNHLKDDFLWDGLEDDFQEELSRACQDYVDFARQYRARTGGQQVSPAVVQATNDEIAQELTEEEMLERLTIAETGTVPDELDEAVRDAKAEMLRAQKIEPRIITVGGWTFRIFHPVGMAAAEPYFFRQSASDGEIDIFLNDNHPYVEEVTDESDYLMYARMCIIDGIVEHFLLHHPGKVTASFPARLKDNLLRGFRY
jgi:hypothetical protein